MSDLVLRKIPFKFEDVDVLWNLENPAFSMMMNQVTFQVVGFERYIRRAIRDAEKFVTDPAILEEAGAFDAQEKVHSLWHKKHPKALAERHPGLEEVSEESNAGLEDIYRSVNLSIHLACAANIEATFTPLFGTIINPREILFNGGDPRFSALKLWHFCKEIEHRCSALKVYNPVVKSRLYRTTQFRKVLRHVGTNAKAIKTGFREHLPFLPDSAYKGAFSAIPFPARAKMGSWNRSCRGTIRRGVRSQPITQRGAIATSAVRICPLKTSWSGSPPSPERAV